MVQTYFRWEIVDITLVLGYNFLQLLKGYGVEFDNDKGYFGTLG